MADAQAQQMRAKCCHPTKQGVQDITCRAAISNLVRAQKRLPCRTLPAVGRMQGMPVHSAGRFSHIRNLSVAGIGRAWRCELSPRVCCAAAMARLSPGARSSIAAARGTCADDPK